MNKKDYLSPSSYKLKWIASHLESWRITINLVGHLMWIDDAGHSIEEIVSLPDDWDGGDSDLALLNMAIDSAMNDSDTKS